MTIRLPLSVLAPDKVITLLAVSFNRWPAPLITPLRICAVLELFCNSALELMAMLPA